MLIFKLFTMNIKFLSLFFIALLFSSCNSNEDVTFERVSSRNGYAIDVLSSMEPSTSLNDEASLQFFDQKRQLFMIVLDEDKQEMNDAFEENEELLDYYSVDFEGYASFLLDNFAYSMEIKREVEIKDTTINNRPAKLIGLVSELEGTDIFYSLAFVDGVEKYYQIWTWTYASLEKEHTPLMNKIALSFKEL